MTTEEKEFLKRIISGFELLINAIKENKTELTLRDENILWKLENAKKKLLQNGKLDFNSLTEVKDILKFRRIYPILEIGDKDEDIESFWVLPLRKMGKVFSNKWGLEKSEVDRLVESYEFVLKLGFLEAIIRKGMENNEPDVIHGIRWNLGRGRLLEEYMLNLVGGWLTEDLVKSWLENKVFNPLLESAIINDFRIEYGAHDQERVIKFSGGRITGEPDFKLVVESNDKRKKVINLEVQRVQKSYTGEENKFGEVKMRVPGHRESVERKVLEKGEHFLMVLIEIEKGLIGLSLNPYLNNKVDEKRQYSYVWATMFEASEKDNVKMMEFFEEII